MTSYRTAMIALHSAVLLFALSGLFAKWLTVSASVIVFGRAAFAAIALGVFIRVIKAQSLIISNKYIVLMAVTGAVLALHWLSFFYAIQVSSVAIGLITFATFPVIVGVFEPLFFKLSFRKDSLIQALLTLIGVALVLPWEELTTSTLDGIFWGFISALLFAILAILNRKYVRKISPQHVACYQNLFASLLLIPVILFNDFEITFTELSLLVLLGVVFTALAHSLYNLSLTRLHASTASIGVSLEPIYGIVAASIFLNELLTPLMILGASIVIFANVWAAKKTINS